MQIKTRAVLSEGEIGQRVSFRYGVVQFNENWSLDIMAREIAERGLTVLAFDDPTMFADPQKVVDMCLDMRVRGIDVLWSACLDTVPTGGLLKSMRLAGCQRVDMMLNPDEAVEGLFWARRYGFEVRIRNTNGMPYIAERIAYTVVEREAIAERLSGSHSAQFDLAVAYFKAQRYGDVMLPLGKAMTLGFPMNELCLNLLACLSAVKHYPDQAAGLLDQAGHGCPHPIVFRNRDMLKAWLASGGDLKGHRLMLESESLIFP